MPDGITQNSDPTGGTSVLGEELVAPPVRADRFAHVKSEAASLQSEAGDKLRAFASTGKDSAVEALDDFVASINEVADQIEAKAGPQVAGYARQAAEYLEEFSETLRTSDVDDLVDGARDLVRRSPALAIGAAATLGFALSRFLKATSERLEPDFAATRSPTDAGGRPKYDA